MSSWDLRQAGTEASASSGAWTWSSDAESLGGDGNDSGSEQDFGNGRGNEVSRL